MPSARPPLTAVFSLKQFSLRAAQQLGRPSFLILLTLALIGLGLALGQRWSERAGMAQLAAVAAERLELYAATLEAELARHAYLPSLISIDADVLALLQAPGNNAAPPGDQRQLRRLAALKLARINVRAGASMTFVTDAQGQVLASSADYRTPGQDREAIQVARRLSRNLIEASVQTTGHFFAANEANGSTDYFLVQKVARAGQRLGLIVVKLNLAPLEATWVDQGLRSQGEKLMVLDDHDVVIMSSVPAWKYQFLGDAGSDQRAALQASGRYIAPLLTTLGPLTEQMLQQEPILVHMPVPNQASQTLQQAQQRAVVPLALRLVTLSDPAEVWRQARFAGWGGGAAGAAIGMLALYLASRRRALKQLFGASVELQRAHGKLELLVDERTHELRMSNEELKLQIAQRLQAEDELMQTAKLAVLGQMSAGIAHEINQPLTALRALSRNSLLLLEQGRNVTVADNLRAIDAMVERMTRITRQLKTFARKAETVQAPVSLAAAVNGARQLLEHRLQAEQVQLSVEVSEALRVRCEPNRLEQVLVNLLTNAMDAMQDAPLRQLRISAVREGKDRDARIWVRISDTGKGMTTASLQRLFEPFFTTKPAGQGLGLGLVISSKIIHEFGGTLRATSEHTGAAGMTFEFDLEDCDREQHV